MTLIFAIGTVAVVVQIICVYSVLRRRRQRKERYKQWQNRITGYPSFRGGSEGPSTWRGSAYEKNKTSSQVEVDEARFSGSRRELRATTDSEGEGTISPYLPPVSNTFGSPLLGSPLPVYDGIKDISRRAGSEDDHGTRSAIAYGGIAAPGKADLFTIRYGDTSHQRLSPVNSTTDRARDSVSTDGRSDRLTEREGSELDRPGVVYLTAERVRNPYDGNRRLKLTRDSVASLSRGNSLRSAPLIMRALSPASMGFGSGGAKVSLPSSPRDTREREKGQVPIVKRSLSTVSRVMLSTISLDTDRAQAIGDQRAYRPAGPACKCVVRR